MLRDFLQHSVQKSILIVIPGGDGNDPVISHLFRMEIERCQVASNLEIRIKILAILVQVPFSHCAELFVIGRLDALLLTDLGQYFLLFGWAAATAAGRQQGQSHHTHQKQGSKFLQLFHCQAPPVISRFC